MNAYAKLSQQQSAHSKRANLELIKNKRSNLKIYSTSSEERFLASLQELSKTIFNLSVCGLVCCAISYFCLISVELSVSKHFRNLEKQMKYKEDLKSYLGRFYSWHNLQAKAEQMHFSEARKIETASKQRAIYHNILDKPI